MKSVIRISAFALMTIAGSNLINWFVIPSGEPMHWVLLTDAAWALGIMVAAISIQVAFELGRAQHD